MADQDPYRPPQAPIRSRADRTERSRAVRALLVSILVFWFAGFASCATLRGSAAIVAWILCQGIGMGAGAIAVGRAFRAHAIWLGAFSVVNLLAQGLTALITDSFMLGHGYR